MALSANRHTRKIVGDIIEIPVYAGAHIYAGGFVCVNTGHGYAIPGADAAGNVCMGIAESEADNSNGLSGAMNVRVRRAGVFLLNATSIAITSQGVVMYVVDDQTFDETSPGNNVKAGVLVKYVSATQGWIDIGRASTP